MERSPALSDHPGRPTSRSVSTPVRARDARIDAFRGLALIMILIDHMPGNPWEALTVRNIGFSDAAEAFFIMSGIAAGIAYSPAIIRWLNHDTRLWDAVGPMWKRAWKLYTVHILLTVVAIALYAWAAEMFLREEFRIVHNLGILFDRPGPAMIGMVTLGYQIGYVNILPTYMVLLIIGPMVIAAGLYAPRLTILAAFALWLFAGATQLNLPNNPGGGGWFFNPFTWQFIFVIGLIIGISHRTNSRFFPLSALMFKIALGFLIFAFAWRYMPVLGPFMNHKMSQLGALGAPANIVTHDKSMLALPRLLHAVALVYVLASLPVVSRICAHRAAAPLRLMGRQGLLVFGLGTALALFGQILMVIEPHVMWLPWVLPVVGAGLCYGAAVIADTAKHQFHGKAKGQTFSTGAPVSIT
jgi:hypothetical protein